jgi:flavin reductase (DIM6/NTAB) family NADH-FMN oxidoreductase RutF
VTKTGRRPRSYGPRGCLLTLALVAALVLFFEFAYEAIDWRSPSSDRIQAATNDLVRRELVEQPIIALTVTAIHSRKKRFSLSTDRWAIEGEVVLAEAEDGAPDRHPYVAIVHTVCDDHIDRRCWVLEQLTYRDRIIRLQDAPDSVIN